jgi:cob(I)alamin adenosyltransferase
MAARHSHPGATAVKDAASRSRPSTSARPNTERPTSGKRRLLDRVCAPPYRLVMPPSEDTFNPPRLAINRVYTRHGDGGETRLVGGQLVPKDDGRLEAYGTVDELNAFVGVARESLASVLAAAPSPQARAELVALGVTLGRVQHELFNLGSILATLPEDVHPKQARVTSADVDALEADMDRCEAELAPLRSFVLPGGCRLNADLHVARTVCRRAERLLVALARTSAVDPIPLRYLNRLSDAFFVWSRWASHLLGAPEVLWQPNLSAGAQAARDAASGG